MTFFGEVKGWCEFSWIFPPPTTVAMLQLSSMKSAPGPKSSANSGQHLKWTFFLSIYSERLYTCNLCNRNWKIHLGGSHCMWQPEKSRSTIGQFLMPRGIRCISGKSGLHLAIAGPPVAVAISCPLIPSPSAPQVHSAPCQTQKGFENGQFKNKSLPSTVFLMHFNQWCTSKIFTESHDVYSWLLTHRFGAISKHLTRVLPSWKLFLLPARSQASFIYSLKGDTDPPQVFLLQASAVGAAKSVSAVAGSLYGRVVAEPGDFAK